MKLLEHVADKGPELAKVWGFVTGVQLTVSLADLKDIAAIVMYLSAAAFTAWKFYRKPKKDDGET